MNSSHQNEARDRIGRMAVRDRYDDIKSMVDTKAPLIVDGGAHGGSIIDIFIRGYQSPTIYAFEPIPDLVDALRSKYRNYRDIHIIQKALGAETKQKPFNIVNNLVSSSILLPSRLKRSYHGSKVNISRTIDVPMVRLDEELAGIEGIDVLKLDLQGYELEALRGCGTLLATTRIITTEVEFVPLYEDQPLFGDIDFFLRSSGFRLFNLYDLWTQPDGQLTAGDAVYLNGRYY